MVEYHVSLAPGGVADIFDQLESNRSTLKIKHFSVSQTTLDEVRKETTNIQKDREVDSAGICWEEPKYTEQEMTGKKGAIVEDPKGIQS